MNRFAYYMSGYAFKAFSGISKAKININGQDKIPKGAGSVIFTANHFTRIETLFLPYHIHQITNRPVWSLAAAELFQGGLKGILEAMGAVSTRDPQRDFLIVKSLINGQADCIIFPEGMMVKNKKITSDGDFKLYEDGQVQRPRTGAATLALQTEFYRERLRRMIVTNRKEFNRLLDEYDIESSKDVMEHETFIVPVNITYYPVRAKENVLSRMALNMMENPSKRVMDELLTEGTMIFSGVDVDIRFGDPIRIRNSESSVIKSNSSSSSNNECSSCEKEPASIRAKDYFFNSFVESDLNSRRKINFSNRLCSYHAMKISANEIMNRYMKNVYEMTTLNYDHIFASILKYMPNTSQDPEQESQANIDRDSIEKKGIDQYDFRCRAYLATFACAMALHCNFHKSLYSNQIHIVTNDRFHRYEDFIQLAIETGVVEEKNGRLYRNDEKLGAHRYDALQYNFHTVRVDNPVSVIANEIEPLVRLQSYFADLAMKPSSEIALLMSYRIEDKQYNSYVDDFNRYVGQTVIDEIKESYIEDEVTADDKQESQDLVDEFEEASEILSVRHKPFIRQYSASESEISLYNNGRPRLFKSDYDGENGKYRNTGILLIHDYLACPGELLPFARDLHSKGFTVYLPRLPGHGTSPDNLILSSKAATSQNITVSENLKEKLFVQWIEAVEEGFVLLRSLCSKIAVGGLGIGGILALALQSRVTDANSLFMVAPPQKIKDYPNDFVTSGGLWNFMIKRVGSKEEWITYLPEMPDFRYSTHPVSGLKQVEMLLENVEYAKILKPTLVVQSRNNQFINPRGAQKLFDMIPASIKEYYIFDVKRHTMLRSGERERISDAIVGFIESIVNRGRAF
ncbi:MAG: 1-acyl-sn-glycerol-3-phosphate acyltransferase [Desulfamplus sp.]|nr:1-acyl-sn-glycerol-3-phosphate acyltransferase [Desulfamplus sp.]